MATILLIETSTVLCSVALEKDGRIISSRSDSSRAHASLTAVFCNEVLEGANAPDAVCISEGPGSYTGLRVGLSTAKGICFGTGAPLLSVCTLDVLAAMGEDFLKKNGGNASGTVIPMLDARRMEVYTARYTSGSRSSSVQALVVDADSFKNTPDNTLFIGDGALKCKDTILGGCGRDKAFQFVETFPDASAMAELAEREYANGSFRDLAYFEPFYLKDFVVTESKKKLW